LPALAALLSYVINGPLVGRDVRGTDYRGKRFLLLAAVTAVDDALSFQAALELGEAVGARPASRCVRASANYDGQFLP
jgi:hypothetical protein